MTPDNRLLGILQTLFPVFQPNVIINDHEAMVKVGLLDPQTLRSLGIPLDGRTLGNSFHTVLVIDAQRQIVHKELLPEEVLDQLRFETGDRREVLKDAAIAYLIQTNRIELINKQS